MNKVLSMILTLALVLSSLTVGGISAKEAKAATNKILTTPIQASEPMTTNTYELDADTVAVTIPVSIQKAGLIEFKATFQGFSEPAIFCLQRNQQFSSEMKDIYIMSRHSALEDTVHEYAAEAPMNCYLLLMTGDADQGKTGSVTVTTTCKEATAGREVKPGETVNAVQIKDKEYYKIKLSAPKKVTVQGDTASLELCNAKKKNLSYCDKAVYLKKGTYYLCHNGSGTYSFSYSTKKITLPKNTSRKKAKKIKLNKAVKGIFACNGGKSQSYWYKLTLKKDKQITLKYKNKVGEFGSVTFLNAKRKLVSYLASPGGKSGKKKILYYDAHGTKKKMKKGTYYILVGNTDVSSEFSLTFK